MLFLYSKLECHRKGVRGEVEASRMLALLGEFFKETIGLSPLHPAPFSPAVSTKVLGLTEQYWASTLLFQIPRHLTEHIQIAVAGTAFGFSCGRGLASCGFGVRNLGQTALIN